MNIINFINYCFYKIEILMKELLYDLTPLAVLVTSPDPFTYGNAGNTAGNAANNRLNYSKAQ